MFFLTKVDTDIFSEVKCQIPDLNSLDVKLIYLIANKVDMIAAEKGRSRSSNSSVDDD